MFWYQVSFVLRYFALLSSELIRSQRNLLQTCYNLIRKCSRSVKNQNDFPFFSTKQNHRLSQHSMNQPLFHSLRLFGYPTPMLCDFLNINNKSQRYCDVAVVLFNYCQILMHELRPKMILQIGSIIDKAIVLHSRRQLTFSHQHLAIIFTSKNSFAVLQDRGR